MKYGQNQKRRPDDLQSLIVARHEAYLREVQQKINESLQAVLESEDAGRKIDVLARVLQERLQQKQREKLAGTTRGRLFLVLPAKNHDSHQLSVRQCGHYPGGNFLLHIE